MAEQSNTQVAIKNSIKIPVSTRIAYGGADVACNIVFGMISTLLVLFYTDYIGVPAVTIGLVMLISRALDGFSDVIMGFIVERTKSKWGQSRPWILWTALPYAIGAVILFTVPQTTNTIQFWYIFITYNFCTTVCYTALNLPYGSLSTMMTRDSRERDMLSIFRMGMSPLGRILAVTFTMPLVKLFGDDQAAWIKTMAIWSVLAFLMLIYCFVKCKETVVIEAREKQEKTSVKESLKALITNQYFWAVLLFWALHSSNIGIVGTILPYYCKYIFGNDTWMYSALYLSETLTIIAVVFFCPLLLKKFGKRNLVLGGAAIALIGHILFQFNPYSFEWTFATNIIRAIGEGPLNAVIFGMIGDVVEFGQWKTHIRQESLIFSGGSVGSKLGPGLVTAMMTGLLSYSGYISSTGGIVVSQPDSALSMIVLIYRLAPLTIWAVIFVISLLYKLDKKYPKIITELAQREARGEL